MRLNYFRSNPNFGDALNPLIFNKFLPGFFDEDTSVELYGIGSIIGFEMNKSAKKRIIFSSGFAYGQLPVIDNSFDIICVRGPLTADAWKIDRKLAITDGAALLREFNFERQVKKFKFSFMPHWESEIKYPWKKLCEETGINYLSAGEDPFKTIEMILQSEIVIAEAMHGAIAADTLRVPWIPAKAYPGINDFKWNDWTKSLNLDYQPNGLRSMYDVNEFVINRLRQKSKNKLPVVLCRTISQTYSLFQDLFLTKETVGQLLELKTKKPFLSDEILLNSRIDSLLEKLEYLKLKYS